MRLVIAFVCLVLASAADAGERARSISVDGRPREYTLIAPDKMAEPLPLLIVYHGGGGTADQARRYTRFDELAAKEGFAVAYPQGLDKNWNDGRVTNDIRERAAAAIDDVAFTTEIIGQLVAEGLIDPTRVFLTGASNGGMMSLRAGCELGPRIAGIAVVIANQPADWRCTARNLPALFINGTADEFMPFAGGQIALTKTRKNLGEVLSVEDTIAEFKTLNGCTGVKETKTLDKIGYDNTTAIVTDYACTTPLKQIVIEGGGHTWPGARERVLVQWVLGNTSQEVSATAEIWSFFKSLPPR